MSLRLNTPEPPAKLQYGEGRIARACARRCWLALYYRRFSFVELMAILNCTRPGLDSMFRRIGLHDWCDYYSDNQERFAALETQDLMLRAARAHVALLTQRRLHDGENYE